jgi:HAD superfamily hydrolase (TIGR01490 family)
MLDGMEAAFFDLDKTVIAKASMVAFGRPLLDAGMISRRLMLRALWSQLVFELLGADEERMRKFRESALRVTAGWDQARISAIVRDALVEVIEPIVYDEALELIRQHKAAGRRVFIISASPEEIVAPLAQYLGVDEAIASRARLDADGRYTGEVEFYSYGPFKAEAMREVAAREGIDLASSYAYSDSATDVPMLEVVGHPVAVNADRELGRIAREREWETRTFSIQVPLRERTAMPPPRRLIAAGTLIAVVTGVGVGLVVWWRMRKSVPPPSRRAVVARRARRRGRSWTDAARRRTRRSSRSRASRSQRQWFRPRLAASSPRRQRGRARR